jgi:hypothetical protein
MKLLVLGSNYTSIDADSNSVDIDHLEIYADHVRIVFPNNRSYSIHMDLLSGIFSHHRTQHARLVITNPSILLGLCQEMFSISLMKKE